MSVEALAVTAVVEQGAIALRKLYAEGISSHDFPIYEEEFKWIEKRLSAKKTLNRRVFRQRFPDFEWMVPDEPVADLALELKEERAFEAMNTAVTTITEELEKDNAIELAVKLREELSRITRAHSPLSDVDLDEWREVIEEMRQGQLLAKQGLSLGLKTFVPHLDHHWGGLMPGQLVTVLGRTGELKSYITTQFAWAGKKQGATVGYFTPEMSAHEVRCRYHTLASADKTIQKAVGLKRSFRNRALLFRQGFPLKSYQAFCQHLDSMPGRIHLLSGKNKQAQMTVGYIEDRIVELGLDLVIVDPIYLLKPVRFYRDNPFLEVGSTSQAIEALAETYNVPVVITNQAHRQGGASDDAPHKDRSFGSDQPAQLADYVLGVKHVSEENRTIFRCTKSRFGGEFRFEMRFYPNTGVMYPLTPLDGNYYNGDDNPTEDELRAMMSAVVKPQTEEVNDE